MKKNSESQKISAGQKAAGGKAPRTAIMVYISALIFLAAAAFLSLRILGMGLVPVKYIAAFAAVAVVWAVFVFLMRRKKAGGVLLSLISLVLAGAMVFALTALGKVDSALQKVSGSDSGEKSEYSVLVLADSAVETGAQLQGGRIAYAENMSEENFSQAVAGVEEAGASDCVYEGYEDMLAAAEALLAGETDAALINSAFIPLISDEAHEAFSDMVRTVFTITVFTETKNNSDKNEENGESGQQSAHQTDPNRFVVYLSGIDTYGSVDVTSRSDVNILAAVNVYTKQVQLINTPRDYYVELPNSDGVKDKLTHGGLYGVEVSMGALEMLYGIDIDYYVRLNFSGFKDIIDALGGVDVYSEYSFLQFSQGYNHLDGEAALTFARERKTLSGGDVQRGINQMAVIAAVIDKMTSVEMLSNYSAVLDSISGCFQTNMSSDEIYALIKTQLSSGGSWSVESYTVTGTGDSCKTFSMPGLYSYVMIPNEEEVEEAGNLLRAVLEAQ